MLARLQCGAGNAIAHLGRRADGDGFEAGRFVEKIVPVAIGVLDAVDGEAALAGDGNQLEGRVLLQHGNMLILGDLAEADDADPMRHPECSPTRYAMRIARKSLTLVSVGPVTTRSPRPAKKQ